MFSIPSVYCYGSQRSFSQMQGHLYSDGCFNIHLQDSTKALNALEAEILAYSLCSEFLHFNFPDDHERIVTWLRTSRKDEVASEAPSEEELAKIDEIYEQVLTVVEFALNRLTAYAESSMADIMNGVRFSVARCLKVGRVRAPRHEVRRKFNTALFSRREIHGMPSMKYSAQWASNVPEIASYDEVVDAYYRWNPSDSDGPRMYYNTIRNTVDGTYFGPSMYVEVQDEAPWADRLISDCWHFDRDGRQCRALRRLVPLMELVDTLADVSSADAALSAQAYADYADMCCDVLVANAALLGFVGKRNDGIDCSSLKTSEVTAAYSSPEGVAMLRRCMLVSRVLDCIIAGATVEKMGRKSALYFGFRAVGMLRMLDAEMFGREVYLPNMVFVTPDDKVMNLYSVYLEDMGFVEAEASHGKGYRKTVDDLENLEVRWNPGGRAKNVKVKGLFGDIRSVSRISPEEFLKKDLSAFRKGTIIACESSFKHAVIRAIRAASRRPGADRDRLWRIVVLLDDSLGGNRTYSAVDFSDSNIVEIGLSNFFQLFDTHSNGILVKTRTSLDSAMGNLLGQYGLEECDLQALSAKVGRDSLEAAVKQEFISYYRGMNEEIDSMQR